MLRCGNDAAIILIRDNLIEICNCQFYPLCHILSVGISIASVAFFIIFCCRLNKISLCVKISNGISIFIQLLNHKLQSSGRFFFRNSAADRLGNIQVTKLLIVIRKLCCAAFFFCHRSGRSFYAADHTVAFDGVVCLSDYILAGFSIRKVHDEQESTLGLSRHLIAFFSCEIAKRQFYFCV